MKSKRFPVAFGVMLLILGIACRVVAFQCCPEKNVPEWIYDLDAIGNALCSSFGYFLCASVCRCLPKIDVFHFAKAVSVVYLFIVCFNSVKEVIGLNQNNSWHQVAYFCAMLSLILFYQYHVYKRDTSDS